MFCFRCLKAGRSYTLIGTIYTEKLIFHNTITEKQCKYWRKSRRRTSYFAIKWEKSALNFYSLFQLYFGFFSQMFIASSKIKCTVSFVCKNISWRNFFYLMIFSNAPIYSCETSLGCQIDCWEPNIAYFSLEH